MNNASARVTASIFLMVILGVPACKDKPELTSPPKERIVLAVPDSTYIVSAFMHDIHDPVNLSGVDFPVIDNPPYGDLVITSASSNTSVVPDSGLVISGTGPTWNLKIRPVMAGYSTITITVADGAQRHSYLLNYAASTEETLKGKSWHSGIADASAAIVIDDDYMVVANDETNLLYLYNRHHSGTPVRYFDFNQGNILALTDSLAGKWKEVDVEAGVRSIKDPSIIYWIGSMSNNGAFLNKPNRNRLFAVKVTGNNQTTRFDNAGHCLLRDKLIAWGNANGYNFDSSAAVGKNCKAVDGFNVEGMAFGPDKKTLYIGFRAPLVPVTSRKKALIAPVKDFEQWFNNGSPVADPQIGQPIELDLEGRGIRDIISTSDGKYVIIAGSSGAEITPAVYTWTGKADAPATLVASYQLAGLNVEGVVPVYEDGRLSLNKLQVLTDNGNQIFYGDTILAKNLPAAGLKKFSSVITEAKKETVPVAPSKK